MNFNFFSRKTETENKSKLEDINELKSRISNLENENIALKQKIDNCHDLYKSILEKQNISNLDIEINLIKQKLDKDNEYYSSSNDLCNYVLTEIKSILKKLLEYFLPSKYFKDDIIELDKIDLKFPILKNNIKPPSFAFVNESYFSKFFELMKKIKAFFLFNFYSSTFFESTSTDQVSLYSKINSLKSTNLSNYNTPEFIKSLISKKKEISYAEINEIKDIVSEVYRTFSFEVINEISVELEKNKNYDNNILFRLCIQLSEKLNSVVELCNETINENLKLIKLIIIWSNLYPELKDISINHNTNSNEIIKKEEAAVSTPELNYISNPNEDLNLSNLSNHSYNSNDKKQEEANSNENENSQKHKQLEDQLKTSIEAQEKLQLMLNEKIQEKDQVIKMLYCEIEKKTKELQEANEKKPININNNSISISYNIQQEEEENRRLLEEENSKLKNEIIELNLKHKQLYEKINLDLKQTEYLVDKRIISKQIVTLLDKKTREDHRYDILDYISQVLDFSENEKITVGLKNELSIGGGSNPKKGTLDRISDIFYSSIFDDIKNS